MTPSIKTWPAATRCRQWLWGLFLLAGLLLPTIAAATELQWGGHLKGSGNLLWPADDSLLDREGQPPLVDGSIDLRINQVTTLPWKAELTTHYEAIGRVGELIRHTRRIAATHPTASVSDRILSPDHLDHRQLMDLTGVLDEGHDHTLYHRLDRLHLTLLPDWGFVRLGRQAVTWGDGMIFNPMDLFNPFAPADIERDYKLGMDMATAQVILPDGGDLQLLAVPRRDPVSGDLSNDQASFAAKTHLTLFGLESDLMAAKHFADHVVGASASGTLADAAWRINATWTLLDDHSHGNSDYLSLVANLDYSWVWWQHNFYGFVEYYFNGLGETDYAAALANPAMAQRLDRGELFVLGQHYLAAQLQVELHPLFNLFFNGMVNASDPSAQLQLWGQWDAAENLQVIVGGKMAVGGNQTEYGGFTIGAGGEQMGPAQSLYARITLFF